MRERRVEGVEWEGGEGEREKLFHMERRSRNTLIIIIIIIIVIIIIIKLSE